ARGDGAHRVDGRGGERRALDVAELAVLLHLLEQLLRERAPQAREQVLPLERPTTVDALERVDRPAAPTLDAEITRALEVRGAVGIGGGREVGGEITDAPEFGARPELDLVVACVPSRGRRPRPSGRDRVAVLEV